MTTLITLKMGLFNQKIRKSLRMIKMATFRVAHEGPGLLPLSNGDFCFPLSSHGGHDIFFAYRSPGIPPSAHGGPRLSLMEVLISLPSLILFQINAFPLF